MMHLNSWRIPRMSLRFKLLGVFVACLPLAGFIQTVRADSSDQPALYKAYYLEKEARDYAAARKIYERVAGEVSSPDAQRAARAGAGRCRDHLAAENFATLMPADSLAYIEVSRPGQIVEKLCTMLGIAGKDMQEILSKRPNADTKSSFNVPNEVCISPSLFEVLNSFGGAAVAITHFDPEKECPSGVMVIHHGDVSLLKGLLETAFQFAPTAEKIHEMPTFGADIEGHRVLGVLTESLLIVGSSRELVDGVIGRLEGGGKSLASREDLGEVMSQRTGATFFAYVDMQAALKIAESQMDEGDRREFNTINAIADLRSLRWATYSWGIHEGTLSAQLAIRLADDHRSIAYNLMRLPPMTRKCLAYVPQDAAAVFGLGLNPELAGMALKTAGKGPQQGVTGFDIGREFFGNIQEICAFVVPGKMNKPESENGPDFVPNVGILLAVNDVARSKALWDQILTIPGLVADKEPIKPAKLKIGETDVTAYQIPEFGKIYMTELDGCIAIGVTRNALKAAIHTHEKQDNILRDDVLGKAIANMPKDSSIMLAAHIGRCASVAAGSGDAGAAMVGNQAAQFCKNMVVSFGVGQAPNQFSMRTSITGLPNLNEVLKQYGPMLSGLANMAAPKAPERKPALVSRKPARSKPEHSSENEEVLSGNAP
jgi:hypothetical protein